MELRDFIVTPLLLISIYVLAYRLRPLLTDSINQRYFISALTLKLVGALAIGFIYQFYYNGGDTFNFHTRGSRIIWEAFNESPKIGLKLLFANGDFDGATFDFASRIPFYRDESSYFVIRIAAILDLLTFSSYTATSLLFAVISFSGMWLFFLTFYKMYPRLHRWIAIACFYLPSVFFWGSGLLKDTLTIAALGTLVFSVDKIFLRKGLSITSIIMLVVSIWAIFIVKKYVLLCFIPAALLWVYAGRLFRLNSVILKLLLLPFIVAIAIVSGYWAIIQIGEGDAQYSLDNIARTTKITAYDIGFYSGKDAGSSYSLGELDGSFESMLRLAPDAINVALFRPYLWEVRNILMLLSSIESSGILIFVLYVLFKKRMTFFTAWSDASVLFCMTFSVTFAFAVGVSTFNFGTLARYKIPLLPFLIIGLAIILYYSNNDKKFRKLDEIE